jgi:hypothetical protein
MVRRRELGILINLGPKCEWRISIRQEKAQEFFGAEAYLPS